MGAGRIERLGEASGKVGQVGIKGKGDEKGAQCSRGGVFEGMRACTVRQGLANGMYSVACRAHQHRVTSCDICPET